jgi:cytochrome c
MNFYTGTRFPKWQGNLFVTSMIVGRVPGTGHLERVVFNEDGEVQRESMLQSLKQRIRYVVQGPDELLYLLTDHSDGALLRMEPVDTDVDQAAETEGPNATPLFSAQDCGSCHRLAAASVGPTYTDIARRYALNDANVQLLGQKIRLGGGGAWGEVPMTPHAAIREVEANAMARAILELSQ